MPRIQQNTAEHRARFQTLKATALAVKTGCSEKAYSIVEDSTCIFWHYY
ncbi:MAG: hypothetical protein KDJ38_04870 [Gammaproteobacteria bacterium]|nr:hypothetical protein [Gammaproteobacteria bacterium]